jgi:chromosome segregation ATPase
LKTIVEELQIGNEQLQHQYDAASKTNASLEQHIRQLMTRHNQLVAKNNQLIAERNQMKQQLNATRHHNRILQITLWALLTGISLLMGIMLYRHFLESTPANQFKILEEAYENE